MFYVIVDGKEGWIPSDILRISSRRSSISSSYSRPSRSRSVSPSPMHSRSPSPMDMPEIVRKCVPTPSAPLFIKKPLHCHNVLSCLECSYNVASWFLHRVRQWVCKEVFNTHSLVSISQRAKAKEDLCSRYLQLPTSIASSVPSTPITESVNPRRSSWRRMYMWVWAKIYILWSSLIKIPRNFAIPLRQFCVHFSY